MLHPGQMTVADGEAKHNPMRTEMITVSAGDGLLKRQKILKDAHACNRWSQTAWGIW